MPEEKKQDGKLSTSQKTSGNTSALDSSQTYRESQYQRAIISIGICMILAWLMGKYDFNAYSLALLILLVYVWWKCKVQSILDLVCKRADLEAHREKAFKNAETVEWLNFILNRWLVLSDESLLLLIKNSLDPLLEACLPPFIASIEVSDFTLGTRTPYIKYVEAYDNFDDQRKIRATELSMREPPEDLMTRPKYKAVLDLDLGLCSPDARFVIRVRLGNKGLLGTETDIAIEDFQISGKMQIVIDFNRNIPFPHMASVSLCFLEEPQVSFNIRMLKAVQLMDFPLVRQWITQLVNDTLKLSLVEPDRIYIPLCEDPDEAGRGSEFACGALTMKITGGTQGRPTDDPYWCVLSIGEQKINTKEVPSEGPWSDHVTLLVHNLHYDRLAIKVKGKRKIGTKYTVYQETTPLARLYLDTNPVQEKTFEEGAKSLTVEMEYTALPIVSLPDEEAGESAEQLQNALDKAALSTEDSTPVSGVLLVCVHSGESMIPMDKNGLSDPYCEVYANRTLVKKTQVVKETLDPVWNDIVEFPVANFPQVTLSFVVYDRDENTLKADSDDFLGSCNLKMSKDAPVVLRKSLDIMYKMKSSIMKRAGKLCVSVVFRPVTAIRKSGKPEIPGGFPEGEPPDLKSGKNDARAMEALLMAERGAIHVVVLRGRNLVAMDIGGKSDPFVTLKTGDREKFRTRVQSKTLNPVWAETTLLALPADNEKLNLEVWDKDALSQERMGSLLFNSSTLKELGKDSCAQQWFKLNNTKSGEIQLGFKYLPPEECNIVEFNNNMTSCDAEDTVFLPDDQAFVDPKDQQKSGWKYMLKKRRVFGVSSKLGRKPSGNPPLISVKQPTIDYSDTGPETQSSASNSPRKPSSANHSPRKSSSTNHSPRKSSGRSLHDREEHWHADDETEGSVSSNLTGSEFHYLLLPSPHASDESSESSKKKKFSRSWRIKSTAKKLKAKRKERSVSESEMGALMNQSRELMDAWFDPAEDEGKTSTHLKPTIGRPRGMSERLR